MNKKQTIAIIGAVVIAGYGIYGFVMGEFTDLGLTLASLLISGLYGLSTYDAYKIDKKKDFWFYLIMGIVWLGLAISYGLDYFG